MGPYSGQEHFTWYQLCSLEPMSSLGLGGAWGISGVPTRRIAALGGPAGSVVKAVQLTAEEQTTHPSATSAASRSCLRPCLLHTSRITSPARQAHRTPEPCLRGSGRMSGRGSLANQIPVGGELRGEGRVAGEAEDFELAVGALAAFHLAAAVSVELARAYDPDDGGTVAQ